MSDPHIPPAKLNRINEIVCEDLPLLFATLNLDFMNMGKYYAGACPIHGGDNASACTVYREEWNDAPPGFWKCRSHHCQNRMQEGRRPFSKNIIGFTRGALTARSSSTKPFDFRKTVDFLCLTYGINLKTLKVTEAASKDKRDFLALTRQYGLDVKKGIDRAKVRDKLTVPSPYFLGRGYTPKILDKYDVGTCLTPGKQMYRRAVVPIYDEDYRWVVGSSGRAIDDDYQFKWRHSAGFNSASHLYNYWFAKDVIKKTKSVILVESPGNVWRLEEAGIHNAVATFGTDLSIEQQFLLEKLGVMNIMVVFDNDKNGAGQEGSKRIISDCSRYFNVESYALSEANDIGELSINQVETTVKEHLCQKNFPF